MIDKKAAKRAYNARYYRENRQRLLEKQARYDRSDRGRENDRVRRARYRKTAHGRRRSAVRTARYRATLRGVVVHRNIQARRRARLRGAAIEPLPADWREQLLGFQGGRCAYCHEALGDDAQMEHVIPLARGGPHTWENVVLACPPCNMTKWARTPEEWAV